MSIWLPMAVLALALGSPGEDPGSPGAAPSPPQPQRKAEKKPEKNGEKKEKAGPRIPGGKVRWISLQEALGILRKEYKPILVVYLPPDGSEGGVAAPGGGIPEAKGKDGKAPAGFSRKMESCLQESPTEKILPAFLCVRLEEEALEISYPAVPAKGAPAGGKGGAGGKEAEGARPGDAGNPKPAETVRQRLGIVTGVGAVVILNFREQVTRRFQEKAPSGEVFRRELRAIAVTIERQAAVARKVEKVIEGAEYAWVLGNTRDAVLALVPYDDPKVRRDFDPVLADRLGAVILRFKKEGAKAMAIGTSLESEQRYMEAVEAYQKAGRSFPFLEIKKDSARRAADAMRKAQRGF